MTDAQLAFINQVGKRLGRLIKCECGEWMRVQSVRIDPCSERIRISATCDRKCNGEDVTFLEVNLVEWNDALWAIPPVFQDKPCP